MSEKIEKAIDITKYRLGDIIKELKCPRCKTKGEMRFEGFFNKKLNSHELECSCFYTERVNPKDVEFSYEEPKESKKKRGESNQ